jgi:hypothetical protein
MAVSASPIWLEPLCRIPQEFKSGKRSIRQLFEEAAPDLSDQASFITLVRGHIAKHPRFVDGWQTYSYDKRGSPNPYLDGKEVGFFDGERRNVRVHDDIVDACADFIYREAHWVMERREPE